MSKRRKKNIKKKSPKGPTMAERADRHALYGDSVQAVEAEIDFIDETFQKIRGRKAKLLREDFCGTANTSCEWASRRKDNVAIAVDLDPEVLDWCRANNFPKIKNAADRVTLLQENVLEAKADLVDCVLAMNFSYWMLNTRQSLGGYFKSVRKSLAKDGVFFLDAYGGWEAHMTCKEPRDCDTFTYIWEQVEFDPISHQMDCAIHFKFPDRSQIKNAFTYSWRLWSLPEIRELLEEAGFKKVSFYWEGADEEGDGNGEFELVEKAETDPGWICYIVAEK